MNTVIALEEVPEVPGVYAMLAGRDQKYVAYVGVGGNVRDRVQQHLVRRDSSVVTGAAAVSLNPDLVTEVRWWEHTMFDDRVCLEAAELVAFELLQPTLRSRGGIQRLAREKYMELDFHQKMTALFDGPPTGKLTIISLYDALERIALLENRMAVLEALIRREQTQS